MKYIEVQDTSIEVSDNTARTLLSNDAIYEQEGALFLNPAHSFTIDEVELLILPMNEEET